jgi:uncharacterized protein (TIGR02117 family)
LIATVLIALAAAGAVRVAASWPPPEQGLVKPVWIVRHGWHTRVAVRRADVDTSIWPEIHDVGEVAYVEVGWGDRDFYPEPNPSIWDAIDPVIRPTPAALHVGGFDRPPNEFLPDTPVVRVSVPVAGFDRLTRFIHEHYALDGGGQPVRIRPGYYEWSWFYLASGRYHILNNSNNWTIRALQAAGAPVNPVIAFTAGIVVAQAARVGERLDVVAPSGPEGRAVAPTPPFDAECGERGVRR